jgi:hypothetical protein
MFSAALEQNPTILTVGGSATSLQIINTGNSPMGVEYITYTDTSQQTMTWNNNGTNNMWVNILTGIDTYGQGGGDSAPFFGANF